MKNPIVTRKIGNGKQCDYLVGFDGEWGAVCAGSRPLEFPTADAARAAARKARRTCMGFRNGHKFRARMEFSAA